MDNPSSIVYLRLPRNLASLYFSIIGRTKFINKIIHVVI